MHMYQYLRVTSVNPAIHAAEDMSIPFLCRDNPYSTIELIHSPNMGVH